jgi:hypothetical protein
MQHTITYYNKHCANTLDDRLNTNTWNSLTNMEYSQFLCLKLLIENKKSQSIPLLGKVVFFFKNGKLMSLALLSKKMTFKNGKSATLNRNYDVNNMPYIMN